MTIHKITAISGCFASFVGASLSLAVSSVISDYHTPQYRLYMRDLYGYIFVRFDTHVRSEDILCETRNLECLRTKGFKLVQDGPLHGAGAYDSENRPMVEFTAACKECNVHTDITVIHNNPLTKKTQKLDWSRCSLA
jgi:hypothetical protein